MKLKDSLIIFVLFSTNFLLAQNVVIKGYAKGYENKEIQVSAYDDLITLTTVVQQVAQIDSTGFFELKTNTTKTQKVVLKIGKIFSNIYVEPNKNYEVLFPLPDSSRLVNENIDHQLNLRILIKDTLELNALVMDYNDRFDQFWTKNYQLFLLGKAKHKIDSFKLSSLKYYSSIIENNYLKNYITYSLASLEQGFSQAQRGMMKEHLINKPIEYDHYEYMEFFNAIFKQYLQKLSLQKNGERLLEIINENKSVDELTNLLVADTFLKSPSLRELVILKGLQELYYVPPFERPSILVMIDEIEQKTKVEEHKKIAQNIKKSFLQLDVGAKAPNFNLIDKDGNQISLDDFKGKYVYLDFWASWCGPCLQEMKLIPQLKKKYGSKIIFVSINTDDRIDKMKNYLVKNPKYDWVFLYSGKNHPVNNAYAIKAIPSYFLIDPQGNFVQSPAARPSEAPEELFNKFLNTNKNKSLKIGEK